MRVALYLRVSTTDQSTDAQRAELMRWAAHRGHDVVAVYEDHGISGSKRRKDRPQFDALLKDAVRGRFDVLAVWAVDRLGRSMPDLVRTLEELQSSRVNLYLHQQGLDTSTPSGEALFHMLGVFSQFERAMCVARVRAGLASARAKGKRLGRPSLPHKVRTAAIEALRGGSSLSQAMKVSGAGMGTVARLRRELLNSQMVEAVAR